MAESNETLVVKLPPCDVQGCKNEAEYNVKTKAGPGPWALLCQKHFEQFGIGLGLGKGLRLVVEKANPSRRVIMLEERWASIDDFATLFQYLWYRDFPIDQIATGARLADWTIHIGIVVRNVANLMGYVTRFEHGGRKDAVLRGTEGDEIAVEWEWGGVWGNELKKLKDHNVWRKDGSANGLLKYAVFVSYTHATGDSMKVIFDKVITEFGGAKWPLLLILVQVEDTKEYSSHRKFSRIMMTVFDEGKPKVLRSAPAVPWSVPNTRWSY